MKIRWGGRVAVAGTVVTDEVGRRWDDEVGGRGDERRVFSREG